MPGEYKEKLTNLTKNEQVEKTKAEVVSAFAWITQIGPKSERTKQQISRTT